MLFLYLTLWSSTNTLSVENKSKASFTYDIVLKNYKNTTKTNGYLVYKITSTNGYNMTEYKDMPKDGENGENVIRVRKVNYKMYLTTSRLYDQTYTSDVTVSGSGTQSLPYVMTN